MHRSRMIVLLLALLSVPVAHAETDNLLALDFSIPMVSLSYAHRLTDTRFIGAEAGWGDGFSFMLLPGRHYSSFGHPPNRTPGEYSWVFDLYNGQAFVRDVPDDDRSAHWELSCGIHLARFLHIVRGDWDAGKSIGICFGAQYGTRKFQVGPRVTVGRFVGCRTHREFGIKLAPLIGRVVLAH